MANDHKTQIERSIEHATDRVAQHGYLNTQEVTDRDVMLTGFGFIANRIDDRLKTRIPRQGRAVSLNGKRWLAAATAVGTLMGGVVRSVLGV